MTLYPKELNHEVDIGNVVVWVMLSFQNLDEIMVGVESPNVLIYKGRSHEGMCAAFEEKKHLSRYIHVRASCYDECPNRVLCPYLLQVITVKGLKNSSEGFAILTVPKNLNQVLGMLGKRVSLVIIDDYPLSHVRLQEEKVDKDSVKATIAYLKHYPTLSTVSKMLLDKNEKPEAIIKLIRSVKESYVTELEAVSENVEEDLKTGITPPDLKYLFNLRYADRLVINDPVDDTQIRIYSDLTKRLTKRQVRYLNATPSLGDIEAMKQLGPYEEIPKLSQHRDNWTVLQYNRAKYSRQSLLESEPLLSYINDIVGSVAKQFTFLGQRLVFMSRREVNRDRFCKYFDETHPAISVDYIDFFSADSFGTNEYRNDTVGLIVGAPIKSPVDYCHLAYETLRRPTEVILADIERESKAKHPRAVYPVPREVTDADERNSVIQMIGRLARDGDVKTLVKIVIVITDIPLADDSGYIPENGAKVEQFDLIGELTVRLKELVKVALDSQVMDEIFRQIDTRLTLGEIIGWDKVSKDYHEQTGVSERRIKKGLELRYNLCEVMNTQNKWTKILQFKQGVGQVASSQPVLI